MSVGQPNWQLLDIYGRHGKITSPIVCHCSAAACVKAICNITGTQPTGWGAELQSITRDIS